MVEPALDSSTEAFRHALIGMHPNVTCQLYPMTWAELVSTGGLGVGIDVIFALQMLSVLNDEDLAHLHQTAAAHLDPGGALVAIHELHDRVTDARHRGLQVYARSMDDYIEMDARHELAFSHALAGSVLMGLPSL